MSEQVKIPKELEGLDPVVRPKTVAAMVGFSRVHLDRLWKAGRFPKPIRLSPQVIGWRLSTVNGWIDERAEKGGA